MKKKKKNAGFLSGTIGKELTKALFGSNAKKKKKKLRASRSKSMGLRGILAPSKKKDGAVGVALAIAAAGAAALPFWLLAPGKPSKEEMAKFTGRFYAHRGLYEEDQSVPENTIGAFRRAVEWGYGIELDVQLSKDGFAVVFHDDDLLRACGDSRRVNDVTWDELKTMRLFGTRKTMPLFRDVLTVADGRVPLLVELKSGPRNAELCRSVYAILRDYDGDACIESFDPRIVAWFRRHDPARIRGQLAMPPKDYLGEGRGRMEGVLLGNTLLNAAARPHFINYKIGDTPAPVKLSESMGAALFGWTSQESGDAEGYDAVVFEFYRPEKRI
ncbi:MAG: glycerophosphodiester phosphodiesterase [Ruminococcaceae bacterium]|jgi:glycerophosphoryl diester phosphodiesterase|nr:glycerophosphodiester phosphodiesterase [Oscillospiraceae bacterium]